MLTKRLREKELFEEDLKQEESRQDALKILDEQTEALITAMVAVERRKDYEREEIERYVLRRMEYYEAYLYGMDDSEFALFLVKKLIETIEELEEK